MPDVFDQIATGQSPVSAAPAPQPQQAQPPAPKGDIFDQIANGTLPQTQPLPEEQPGAVSRFASGVGSELAAPFKMAGGAVKAAMASPVDAKETAIHAIGSNTPIGGEAAVAIFRAAKSIVDSAEGMISSKKENFENAKQDFVRGVMDFQKKDWRNVAADVGSTASDVAALTPIAPSGVGERARELSEGTRKGGDFATPLGKTAADVGMAALSSDTAGEMAGKVGGIPGKIKGAFTEAEETPKPVATPLKVETPLDDAVIRKTFGKDLTQEARNTLREHVGNTIPAGSSADNTMLKAVKPTLDTISTKGAELDQVLKDAGPLKTSARMAVDSAIKNLREELPGGTEESLGKAIDKELARIKPKSSKAELENQVHFDKTANDELNDTSLQKVLDNWMFEEGDVPELTRNAIRTGNAADNPIVNGIRSGKFDGSIHRGLFADQQDYGFRMPSQDEGDALLNSKVGDTVELKPSSFSKDFKSAKRFTGISSQGSKAGQRVILSVEGGGKGIDVNEAMKGYETGRTLTADSENEVITGGSFKVTGVEDKAMPGGAKPIRIIHLQQQNLDNLTGVPPELNSVLDSKDPKFLNGAIRELDKRIQSYTAPEEPLNTPSDAADATRVLIRRALRDKLNTEIPETKPINTELGKNLELRSMLRKKLGNVANDSDAAEAQYQSELQKGVKQRGVETQNERVARNKKIALGVGGAVAGGTAYRLAGPLIDRVMGGH